LFEIAACEGAGCASDGLPAVGLFLACRAKPPEFQPAPKNLVSAGVFNAVVSGLLLMQGDISNPAAHNAPDVSMLSRRAVIALLPAANLDFLHNALCGHPFQIAVHGRQADPGHPLPNHSIELVCRRMRFYRLQLFENDLTLVGISKLFWQHTASLAHQLS